MNRTNEVPSGNLKPEKPKPAQTLLKQSNESNKMAVQNIVSVNEMPVLVNEMITVTTSETDNIPPPNSTMPPIADNGSTLNVSNTQEVTTSENEKKTIDVQMSQSPVLLTPAVPSTTTPPKIVHAANNQFVQVKPPTTTSGRVQSPNVKNFFIRKGIEKQPPCQPIVTSPPPSAMTGTFITTQATPSPVNQLPPNKKIIIKSQQIIVPATNIKQNTGQIIQMSSGQPMVNVSAASTPIAINANVIQSSSGDLSGILDLPILFADNNAEGTVQIDQSGQIINASTSSNILLNTSCDRNALIGSPATTTTNIFFNAPDGKLPNRPVVISAAKMTTKPIHQQHQHHQHQQQTTITTTPTTNKLILINRNQIKQQIVGTPTASGHHQIVKGLPTLKLMPTSLASSSTTSTPITLQGNQITKLSPGTKIDLSTLKFVKNTSPIQGSIMKPLIINKAVPKNAILIKSPIGANVQAHPVIKGNVLNRNITVRKVMNVVPNVKQVGASPVSISNVSTSLTPVYTTSTQSISTAILANVSPTTATASAQVQAQSTSTSTTSSKSTRKTRNSN